MRDQIDEYIRNPTYLNSVKILLAEERGDPIRDLSPKEDYIRRVVIRNDREKTR